MSNEPKLFDFGIGKASDYPSNPVESSQGVDSASTSGAATAEASQHIAEVRAKRGRPRKDESALIAERERIREELTRELATLFAPEYWEGIVRGPADLMLAVSKRELWNVPDKEIKPLAMGAAHTARLFLRTDPKWIALFMFSVSLTQVYGGRIAVHMAQIRREARERKAQESRGPASTGSTQSPAALKTV